MANTSTLPRTGPVVLLVGTKKGVFFLRSDAVRSRWSIEGPHFLGHLAYHVVLDSRDERTLLVAARAGHLGPTVFRSFDFGKTWGEAQSPPAFPKAAKGESGRVVHHVFWLEPKQGLERFVTGLHVTLLHRHRGQAAPGPGPLRRPLGRQLEYPARIL